MRAVVVTRLGGPEVLQCQEVPVPTPSADEVLIRVRALSVNYADIKAREGRYHGTGEPPFIPGLDAMGVVEAVGAEVTGVQPGQRVVAFPGQGSYAEYIVAKAALTYPVPDTVDDATAAACPTVALTAYELLHRVARLQSGESVLVYAAAGGVGTTALQLAKLAGAGLVIGAVGSRAKEEVARRFGADKVVVYTEEPVADRVLAWTEGRGVDVILDSVAGPTFPANLQCLARFGRLAVFGNAGGPPGQVLTSDLHSSCRSVLGYSMGTTRRYWPDSLRTSALTVLNLLGEGKLQMHISAQFPLEAASEAHALVASRQSTGKVLLLP
ncbi:MAG: quinone oxidoreductase [Alicyclobacillus sp.]|nr:quinone oxidoreductase [Alicyclobacillus sp.]